MKFLFVISHRNYRRHFNVVTSFQRPYYVVLSCSTMKKQIFCFLNSKKTKGLNYDVFGLVHYRNYFPTVDWKKPNQNKKKCAISKKTKQIVTKSIF